MSIIGNMEKRMASETGGLSDSWYTPGGFFYGGAGQKTKAGSSVSEMNAMRLAVVWCCVKILSEDSASLPLHLYRRLKGGGKERAIDHPLYSLLHDSPNPEMTAMSFRETYKSHLLSWGNAYAEKEFGKGSIGSSRVVALWPITPNRVTVKRNKGEEKKIPLREVYYRVSMAGTGLPDVVLPRRNVLHAPGLSYDGLTGYSPIAAAREAIGLGMSLEEFGEHYFGQGLHPGVVVSHPGKLAAQTRSNMSDALNETYGGLGKSHRLMLLEEGLKIEKVGIPNNDAQFLESRSFQNIDIGSRIYRLPPQMYGEYDKASTYASAEQFSLDYVVKTLRPWLVRMEQAFNMQLLSLQERGEYFFEHLIDGLMRGDSAARASFYASLFPLGGITPNQICEIENWNPIGPEGDKRFVPLNMIPLVEAGKQQETPRQQNNRSIYRSRIESAYSRLFTDAVGRVTRKEAQRVNWIRKNQSSNGAMTEFYREFPEYIKKQAFPVFLSFAEALTGMETELNGLKYDDFKAEIQRFIDIFCSNFASDYVETSQNLEPQNGEWTEREAAPIAEIQTKRLSEAFIEHLQALTGVKQ
ncbi:MAG: phage portal protein [Candidatus Omnitrophota bacterium]